MHARPDVTNHQSTGPVHSSTVTSDSTTSGFKGLTDGCPTEEAGWTEGVVRFEHPTMCCTQSQAWQTDRAGFDPPKAM